jgi:hypothetical protein
VRVITTSTSNRFANSIATRKQIGTASTASAEAACWNRSYGEPAATSRGNQPGAKYGNDTSRLTPMATPTP